ncbi:serine protease snake-like isoform X1 [Danaus plexippus]|uniref:serine protease snake-like isoform X1 n=1 Tax=Danaus plexippus TaxID=13037 RepID=UPI002AAF1A18|nr:serine protease snake-like isoform X1 [Danaus plexippus]
MVRVYSIYLILLISLLSSTEALHLKRKYVKRNTDKIESDPCVPYNATLPNFKKNGRRISEVKCDEYVWQRMNRQEKLNRWFRCLAQRREKEGPDGLFVSTEAIGGRDALPGEFPHMGALGWKAVEGTWIFKCGSTLISPKFTLTAAHCSKTPPDPKTSSQIPQIVRFGDKNIIDVFANGLPPIDANIVTITVHPQYKSPSRYNDIALVKLDKDIIFMSNVQPACLWSSSDSSMLGSTATLTGWGVIETATRKTSPILQAAVVDVIDDELCNKLLQRSCSRQWCGVRDQICAGKLEGGVDACQGDSGGPLQVKIPLPPSGEGSMHYVIGVTSFGIGCARPNLPGVYTKVSSFVDWIESIVWPEEKI